MQLSRSPPAASAPLASSSVCPVLAASPLRCLGFQRSSSSVLITLRCLRVGGHQLASPPQACPVPLLQQRQVAFKKLLGAAHRARKHSIVHVTFRRTPDVPVPAIATCPVEADPLKAVIEPQRPALLPCAFRQLLFRQRLEAQHESLPIRAPRCAQAPVTCISGPNPTSSAHRFQTSQGSAPPLAWLCPRP